MKIKLYNDKIIIVDNNVTVMNMQSYKIKQVKEHNYDFINIIVSNTVSMRLGSNCLNIIDERTYEN